MTLKANQTPTYNEAYVSKSKQMQDWKQNTAYSYNLYIHLYVIHL